MVLRELHLQSPLIYLSREFLQNISILKLASCFKDKHRGCGANEFPLRPLHPVVNSQPYLLLNLIPFVKVMKYESFPLLCQGGLGFQQREWGWRACLCFSESDNGVSTSRIQNLHSFMFRVQVKSSMERHRPFGIPKACTRKYFLRSGSQVGLVRQVREKIEWRRISTVSLSPFESQECIWHLRSPLIRTQR